MPWNLDIILSCGPSPEKINSPPKSGSDLKDSSKVDNCLNFSDSIRELLTFL